VPCSAHILRKYLNHVFVETGTYLGEGVAAALESGFKNVYTIELSMVFYEDAIKKFSKDDRVRLVHGDSSNCLWDVISGIREPITFWLDAHCSLGNTAKGEKMCPLIEELSVIAMHPIKTHTILVDDRRLLGSQYMEPTEDDVVRALIKINPLYQISYEDGATTDDIIVARER